MFILKSKNDYPDELNIISKSRGALEEIALSLYEEDMYEWYCVLAASEPRHFPQNVLMKEAKIRAKADSELYYIETATEIEF